MIYEIPVTTDDIQEQSFDLFGYSLRLTLRYNAVGGVWQFDLLNLKTLLPICQNTGLAVNAPALFARRLPFVLVLADGSGLGINSLLQDEFGNRLKLYLVAKEVWREAVRQAS
ncbi:hypothetical protein LU604_26680 (plasmid) [Erwinia tracheiphila]|uniref:phage baseplate plug family protein n=1 Tax=Erwinia tracheiphila TaxID=65700 RepID=UPI001F3F0849|nr:hypothetical protein [Erwinia tracheiphila]UIA85998.1 hypothetical protein LU604_26680 [Erwinia tracheiphila]